MEKVARVYMNNIEVGSLPAEQYESIVKAARRDWRLSVAQVLNLLVALTYFITESLRFTPWVWFVLSIILLLADPALMSQTISNIVTGTPEQATMTYAFMVKFGWSMAAFTNMLAMTFGWRNRFGYENQIDKQISQKLRQILEVPAEGDMKIVCVEIDG